MNSKSVQEPLEAVDIDQVILGENEAIVRFCKSRKTPFQLNPVNSAPDAHPDRLGLAFSGGGIRSASVNLGLIQALSERKVLKQAHYICGVSGGGYILGWLTAWIARVGFANVQEQLENNSASGAPLPKPTNTTFPRYLEPDPIHYLRRYVSYLVPRSGLGSGDTLAAIAIYLRNLLLVQTLAALALVCVTAAAQTAAPTVLWNLVGKFYCVAMSLATVLATTVVVAVAIGRSLGYLARNEVPPSKLFVNEVAQYGGLLLSVAIWLGLPILLKTSSTLWIEGGAILWVAFFCSIGAGVAHWGIPGEQILKGVSSKYIGFMRFLAILSAGLFAALLTHLFQLWLVRGNNATISVGNTYAILGLPAILLAISLTSFLYIGVLGGAFPDAKREWLGRLAGYYLYFSISIAVLLFIVLLGPACMSWLFLKPHTGFMSTTLKWVLPGGWIFTTISGLFAARSPSTGDFGKQTGSTKNTVLEVAAVVAPPVFLMGLLLLGAWGTHALVGHFDYREYLTYGSTVPNTASRDFSVPCKTQSQAVWKWDCKVSNLDEAFSPLSEPVKTNRNPGYVLFCIVLASGFLTFVLGSRLSVNEFSLHLFYRNRLVRTFLGASNVDVDGESMRKANPFTGFALDDDEFLGSLQQGTFDGPYPIWATALNLTEGEDLAWQERKASSFIFSPLYCGWDYFDPKKSTDAGHKGLSRQAYIEVAKCQRDGTGNGPGYGGEGGAPLIGTAMAASGAAISPNWGYHTKPATAALLALFNIRIGWWTPNPRSSRYVSKYAPKADYYLRELLGSTNENSNFVYLSDGGHFENLGIYELVRRRVKYIIACDADADGEYTFGDLANAVEKCRVDFGVQIDLKDYLKIAPKLAGEHSSIHYAVGIIHYLPLPPSDAATQGVLLYIKSSLTGDETAQVLGQKATDPAFPHDSTLNQFFDETQFEAYRSLGEHLGSIVWDAFLGEQTLKNKLPPSTELERSAELCEFFNEFLAGGIWRKAVTKS